MRDLNALGGFNFYTEGGIVQGTPYGFFNAIIALIAVTQ